MVLMSMPFYFFIGFYLPLRRVGSAVTVPNFEASLHAVLMQPTWKN